MENGLMKKRAQSRRDFLKASAAATAALSLGSSCKGSQTNGPTDGNEPTANPDISSLRIVCCHDEKMLISAAAPSEFADQNDLVDSDRVDGNLDEMAKRLAFKDTADLAWSTIFRSSKSWAETKVGFKVNCINTFLMFHVAIIRKIADVLNNLGVPYVNMTVYDAGHNASGNEKYSPYNAPGKALEGMNVLDKGLQSSGPWASEQLVAIPGHGNHYCAREAIEQDIIVNCAVNKGHDEWTGNTSLTLKNHYGTFKPDSHSDITYPFGLFKSAVLSGGPIPRQQLCVVDSLWGSRTGPMALPDGAPYHRLVMGTFSPVVDYGTIKNIRIQVMNAGTGDEGVVESYMTHFGYSDTDLEWVEFSPEA
jgi:hypothetical protein